MSALGFEVVLPNKNSASPAEGAFSDVMAPPNAKSPKLAFNALTAAKFKGIITVWPLSIIDAM